jgi:pyrroline-5-carboxylate reductase
MGGAIISALISDEVTEPASIRASDPNPQVHQDLAAAYPGIDLYHDNAAAVEGAEVIVLAVKPQIFPRVVPDISGKIAPDALILSIMAGVTVSQIRTALKHEAIVRSMPNTPAQIGAGITTWMGSPSVTPDQEQLARSILSGMGADLQVAEERYLDMATAVAGSGPAYVYLFMEAMIDAAVHLGFSRVDAEQLVTHTVKGSVDYYLQGNADGQQNISHFRNQVTSPGGTTAAGLYELEKAGLRTAMAKAIKAAHDRSVALGK